MEFLRRDLSQTLKKFTKFPVIALLGPRQSGKTTLVKKVFKNYQFVNLEAPDVRERAISDPRRFLRELENKHGVILDEFQHAPQILSYIQIEADEKNRPGYFVLTGSQNFLMNQAISQSLAGRVGLLTLLPLSLNELKKNSLLQSSIDEVLLKGGYPRLYTGNFLPNELYQSYLQSYVERDVRQLVNVGNLRNFQKFMQLCAGRIGQLTNFTDLATNCGISRKTADQWISLLEASYIIFLLPPHFNNFNKRLVKTPKLYFYDTGLACSLLGIQSTKELSVSTFRGHLFENLIIADLFKQYFNLGQKPPLSFWRDRNGRIEIDCLIKKGTALIPVEIKSSETIVNDFFHAFPLWASTIQKQPASGYVIYAGPSHQTRPHGEILSWKMAGQFVNRQILNKKEKTKRK